MKIKSVFFDLDGTLLDTALDLGAALNATLKQFDLPILTPQEIRPHVSNGANALIKLGFGEDLNDAEHQVRRQSLLDYYLENVAQYTIAFSGIETLLEQLNQQGIVWGIATNKPRLYAEALMDQITLPSEHIALICPEDIENKKPAPDSLFFACELAKCQSHELVYIGDHVRDIECAKAAQCPNIAAAYGYINEPDTIQHWQADHIANEAADIFPILEKINTTL